MLFALRSLLYKPTSRNFIFKLQSQTKNLKILPDINRYKKISEQEVIISNIIKKGKPLNKDQWTNLKQQILNMNVQRKSVTQQNFNGTILNQCFIHDSYTMAKSYIDFLGNEQNLAILSKFLRICYKSNEANEIAILNLYDKVKNFEFYDIYSCENIVLALSKTYKWDEGLIYKDKVKSANCIPTKTTYASLITSAFKNNQSEIGWRLIEEIMDSYKNTLLPEDVLEAILLTAKNEEDLNKFFNFFYLNGIYITRDFSQKLISRLQDHNIKVKYSKITNRGKCLACQQTLNPIEVEEEKFVQLKNYFLNNILLGDDIFSKSSPEEWKKLKNLIEKTSYDIIFDGLNIAYSRGNKVPPKYLAKNILSVLNFFASQNKNVLIFGRNHMRRWPQYIMKQIESKALCIYLDDLSQDDLYFLYAALHSGLGTYLISDDLLRNHSFKFTNEPELLKTFRQWQCKYQIQVKITKSDQVILQPPLKFIPIAQQINNTWHLPLEDTRVNENRSNVITSPDEWLCITFEKRKVNH